MGLFSSSSSSSSSYSLSEFLYNYRFSSTKEPEKELIIGRVSELLGTLPEIISGIKEFLNIFSQGSSILAADQISGWYEYANKQLQLIKDTPLGRSNNQYLANFIEGTLLYGKNTWRVIDVLFYDYVTIRDGILRFKYAIDDRKDYIPSKEESNNETDKVIERYNLLEKSIYSLESIPVDGIISDDILS